MPCFQIPATEEIENTDSEEENQEVEQLFNRGNELL